MTPMEPPMFPRAYPSCCTSTIVTGMGESQNSSTHTGDNMTPAQKFDKLVQIMQSEKRYGHAMVQCIITDQQQQALAAMRALGWRFGPWAKSRNHPNTNTRLCYWLVQDGIYPEVHLANVRAEYLEKVARYKLK